MTIYDVPVDDTVFFPVSGDMLRQMKADEERRDRIIRDKMPKHRAEHLINTLNAENGTGSPAKNSPDAADLNTLIGEQTVMNDTSIVSETLDPDASRWHPIWCNPDDEGCYVNDDVEHHEVHAGRRHGFVTLNGAITGQVRAYSWDDDVQTAVLLEDIASGEKIELSWWEMKKLHDELLPRMLSELEIALGQED